MASSRSTGEYNQARHDAFFGGFGDNGLDAGDIAAVPRLPGCLRASRFPRSGNRLDPARLRRRHAGEAPGADRRSARAIADQGRLFRRRPAQPASSPASPSGWTSLRPAVERLQPVPVPRAACAGWLYRGPALFSIYSGANGGILPPYLTAAAAAKSRAFPAFTYDPSAGSTGRRASRSTPIPRSISIGRCSVSTMRMQQQLVSETTAFTLVDFRLRPRCGNISQGSARQMERQPDAGRRIPGARAERTCRTKCRAC